MTPRELWRLGKFLIGAAFVSWLAGTAGGCLGYALTCWLPYELPTACAYGIGNVAGLWGCALWILSKGPEEGRPKPLALLTPSLLAVGSIWALFAIQWVSWNKFLAAPVSMEALWILSFILVELGWMGWWIYETERRELRLSEHRREEVGTRGPEVLWEELAECPEEKAWEIVLTLAARRDRSVGFLKERLLPAQDDPAWVGQLISGLDHLNPGIRDAVSADLEGLGQTAEPFLREALAGSPTTETRSRLERLLGALQDPARGFPETRRRLRAIQALKLMGSAGSLDLLRTLAGGAEASVFTREAAAALSQRRI